MPDKWFVADAHNQYIPREAVLKSKGTMMDLSGEAAAIFRLSLDMERKLAVMDEAGIDMALIHMASLNLLGLDFCRTMNDGNARTMREYPDRVIALAHLPLDEAASPEGLYELERAICELGLKGVALETSGNRLTLGSEELFPLYEKISLLGVPVVVHPSNVRLARRGSGLKHAMATQAEIEIENTNACIEVMFGVLTRFPDIKFLMPHHGGALPLWQGRLKLSYVPEGFDLPDSLRNRPLTPRIRKELGLDKPFQELLDKLYFDTSGFGGWMPATGFALSQIRANRLCFGTDYGFEMNEAADIALFIKNIKELDIAETDKRNVLGENIKRLFAL